MENGLWAPGWSQESTVGARGWGVGWSQESRVGARGWGGGARTATVGAGMAGAGACFARWDLMMEILWAVRGMSANTQHLPCARHCSDALSPSDPRRWALCHLRRLAQMRFSKWQRGTRTSVVQLQTFSLCAIVLLKRKCGRFKSPRREVTGLPDKTGGRCPGS